MKFYDDYITLAVQYLNKRFNTNINTDYYTYVNEWEAWWRGFYSPFHSYRELGIDGTARQRKLYTMKMAKRVCEDWAALLLNEKTNIVIDDEASSEFVQGINGMGGVLGANHFWQQGNELIEKAFATGTGAFLLRVNNAKVSKKGAVIADDGCSIGIQYINAQNIIPLSVEAGKITEVAFVSELTKRGKNYIYIETHCKDDKGNYVIENNYFLVDGGILKEMALPDGVADSLNTGNNIPWFALIYPNISNNIIEQNGLGMSIYADATDNLEGVDLAYNNFLKDFKLGGKKVFYNKSMLQTNGDGKNITPDDVAQQLFQQVGDGMDFDAKAMVQEFNPSLRVEENKAGVQAQLDYLSFKCGLGNHRYQFDSAGVKTATEYVGEKQEMVQHASKNMIVIEQALINIVHAILYIGKVFCNVNVNPDATITINFEDGFIISDEDKQAKDLSLVQQGIMLAWEYRVKWFGETPEEAKAALAELQTAQGNPFGFLA